MADVTEKDLIGVPAGGSAHSRASCRGGDCIVCFEESLAVGIPGIRQFRCFLENHCRCPHLPFLGRRVLVQEARWRVEMANEAPIAHRSQLETAAVQTQGRLQATAYTIVDDPGREAYDKQKNSTEKYIRIGQRGRTAVSADQATCKNSTD